MLSKVATQWNSGATRESNRGPQVRIPSALTTEELRHTTTVYSGFHRLGVCASKNCEKRLNILKHTLSYSALVLKNSKQNISA